MLSWLRFGQPIGSALITAAILDTILNSFWFLLQYCNLENDNYARFFHGPYSADFEFYGNLLWNFVICLRLLLSFMLWTGVIIWGKKLLLITWLLLSIITDAATLTSVIYNYAELDHHTNLWLMILGIGVFILFRLYITLVGIQGVIQLHTKYNFCRSQIDNVSDIDVCLEPISFGVFQVWDFYKDLPGMGVIILLTAELVWNLINIGCREMTGFMFGMFGLPILNMNVKYFPGSYLILEETVMRCVRIFLAFAGLVFIRKTKLNLTRLWICVYFLALICSNGIFVFLGLSWIKPGLDIIIYYSIYIFFDNLFRFLILYFSCKFAMVHRRTIVKD